MAYSYKIIKTIPSDTEGCNYITVIVKFDDLEFEQLLISNKIGAELDAQLETYSKDYYDSYNANLPPIEPIEN